MSRSSPVTESLRAELSHAICRPNDTKGVVTLSKQLDAVVAIFERFALAQQAKEPDLLKYANHLTNCRYRGGHDCDCGLEEIRAAVSQSSTDRQGE